MGRGLRPAHTPFVIRSIARNAFPRKRVYCYFYFVSTLLLAGGLLLRNTMDIAAPEEDFPCGDLYDFPVREAFL